MMASAERLEKEMMASAEKMKGSFHTQKRNHIISQPAIDKVRMFHMVRQ